MIEHFAVSIPESQIEDLRARLKQGRSFSTIGNDWSEGVPSGELSALIDYWQNEYNWRKNEKKLNTLPQYMCTLDCGQKIHFIYKKGSGLRSRPLLMIHGWPGSIVEMENIIPLLTEPQNEGDETYDLIIPSLPGYGFSPGPKQSGTGLFEIAGMLTQLMSKLGYESFLAQGGDWGAHVTSWIAYRFPDKVTAIHLNFLPGSYSPVVNQDEPLSHDEEMFLEHKKAWYAKEGGYDLIQSTRPATLAYGLNDSPAGLAAWIFEKFHRWSDWNNSFGKSMDLESIFTNISIYWFTGSIYSSVRLYLESEKRLLTPGKADPIKPVTGFALTPSEISSPPRSWVERGYNLVYWKIMPAGGHFAVMEQPEMMATDIRHFFTEYAK